MFNIGAIRSVGVGGGVGPLCNHSQGKNRAVCSHLFCCLCVWDFFLFFFFLLVCVLRCTCVHCACTEGHSCSTIIFPLHSDLYTGGPHWVSRHAELVPVWVYSRRYFICEPFFVRAPRSSAVCWQLLASLEFSKKLVCCFGLQLFKFLCQFFTLSVK